MACGSREKRALTCTAVGVSLSAVAPKPAAYKYLPRPSALHSRAPPGLHLRLVQRPKETTRAVPRSAIWRRRSRPWRRVESVVVRGRVHHRAGGPRPPPSRHVHGLPRFYYVPGLNKLHCVNQLVDRPGGACDRKTRNRQLGVM